VFWLRFVPRARRIVRGTIGAHELIRRWDATLVVDSAGEGSVLAHFALDPPLAELEPNDYEHRALELVRADLRTCAT
jgi:hypothetical protein